MKKKVGELYDKPIVIGNPNEFTKDEIPLNELKQGKNQYLYFSVDYDDYNSFLEAGGYAIEVMNYFKLLDSSGEEPEIGYTNSPDASSYHKIKIIGACLIPNFRKDPYRTTMDVVNLVLNNCGLNNITDIPGVTPITEEEFYTI